MPEIGKSIKHKGSQFSGGNQYVNELLQNNVIKADLEWGDVIKEHHVKVGN